MMNLNDIFGVCSSKAVLEAGIDRDTQAFNLILDLNIVVVIFVIVILWLNFDCDFAIEYCICDFVFEF